MLTLSTRAGNVAIVNIGVPNFLEQEWRILMHKFLQFLPGSDQHSIEHALRSLTSSLT
jgi:hypothetical protein